MDNLKDKSIQQFNFDTDDGEIIITAIIDESTNFVEWWGHVKGYCTSIMLFGMDKKHSRSYNDTALYCVSEYYDAIVDTKGE